MIFARKVSDNLTSLVKKIDDATVKNKAARMGSFVVFLNDEEGLRKQLEGLAKKENLQRTVLTIDNPAGPRGYGVSKDADVVVVLYDRQSVKYNLTYGPGQLNQKAIDTVMSDLQKMLTSN
jgi:hypothetical protein